MAEHSELIIVTTSWKTDQKISDLVELYQGDEDMTYIQKRGEISASTTSYQLNGVKDDENPLMFELLCKPGTGLLEFCICSDVGFMEVFDQTEGYLMTTKGKPGAEGLNTFIISFKKPRTGVSIKVCSKSDKIKVSQILLRIQPVATPLAGYGSLNVSTLRDIITDLGPETLDRAHSILDNIETYQKNEQSRIEDMSSVLTSQSCSSNKLDMDGFISAFDQLLQSQGQMTAEERVHTDPSQMATYSALQNICSQVASQRTQESTVQGVNAEDVDKMVEQRISQAEARILETVDERLQKMEDRLGSKLDALLNTISSSMAATDKD